MFNNVSISDMTPEITVFEYVIKKEQFLGIEVKTK